MTLARIIRSVKGEQFSIIPVRRLTLIFVTCDIFTLCVQGGAAGMMVAANVQKIGQGIVIGSLFFQIAIFGFFAYTALAFHRRICLKPTPECYDESVPWKQGLNMIYGISALIMIRSIFRVIEFILGVDGYLYTHEWTMYVFDTFLMSLVVAVFYLWYPSHFQVLRGEHVQLQYRR